MTAVASREPIRVLPTLVADQIAAGEVVERPASVVKELVENSLDAGASRVEVELEAGGIELIRVTDDGCGIEAEQLELALRAHATSKLRQAEDLTRIGTLGFRGEALASVASVARVTLRSAVEGRPAAVIEASGDARSEARPASGARGTRVEVRTLFFNTPARRRFLRTAATEQARCVDVVRDLAMAHPAVAFRVSCDGRAVLDLRGREGPRARALELLGAELADQLLEVRAGSQDDARGAVLWGLVGRPAIARAGARHQHLFVNGRAVRDATLQHGLREAYRGLIEPGRYPTAVLMLDVPAEAVDVNVHPAKAEVRFRDQGMIHSLVLGAVREALQRADLTPTLGDRAAARPALFGAGGGGSAGAGHGEGVGAERFAEYFTRDVPAATGGRFDYQAVREALDRVLEMGAPARSAVGPGASGGADDGRESASHASGGGVGVGGAAGVVGGDAGRESAEGWGRAGPARAHLQVHQSYVVAQDEAGVVIIDQHALHERAMFEALRERITSGPLESQRLLVPAVVEASPERVARFGELSVLLERLGIDAAPMSVRSVGVHAFPTLLFSRGVEPTEFLADLLARADAEGFVPDSEEALREVLDMMACKAAVKAGDRLSDEEISTLVGLRGAVERSSSCPHGRPTSVRLTLADLERLFERR